MSEKDFERAKEIAIRQIYIGDKTENQIREKLIEKDFSDTIIDEVIEQLKEIKYIDDIAYVRKYIDYGFSKGRGIFRIKEELKKKGIVQFDIEDGLYEYCLEKELEISEMECKVAKTLLEYELKERKFLSQKDRDRLARKLSYRGFSYELINRLLKTIPIGEDYERR